MIDSPTPGHLYWCHRETTEAVDCGKPKHKEPWLGMLSLEPMDEKCKYRLLCQYDAETMEPDTDENASIFLETNELFDTELLAWLDYRKVLGQQLEYVSSQIRLANERIAKAIVG